MLSLLQRLFPALIAAAVGLSAGPAQAGPFTDEMARCLVNSTSREDRDTLVRWIVTGYSAHPMAAGIVQIDRSGVDEINRQIGELVSDLLLRRCLEQSKQAFKFEGQAAFEQAFEVLGSVAGQELVAEPSVNSTIMGFVKYLDSAGMEREFAQ